MIDSWLWAIILNDSQVRPDSEATACQTERIANMRTTRNRPVLTLAALAATLASCGTAAVCLAAAEAEEPVNLVANGDFSEAAGGKPEKWATSGSPANVAQTLSVEKDADGKPFATAGLHAL